MNSRPFSPRWCEKHAYTDAEVQAIEKEMLAPEAYATNSPRVVILRLLATIKKSNLTWRKLTDEKTRRNRLAPKLLEQGEGI